jgi:endoglycosylceramidase
MRWSFRQLRPASWTQAINQVTFVAVAAMWLMNVPTFAQTAQNSNARTKVLIPERFVQVAGDALVDGKGHRLQLHGFNVANFLKHAPDPLQKVGEADLDRIQSLGMNCIRLTIFWNNLEPQPGQINSEYLDHVASLVQMAKSRGIYVLLDMHQDLYGDQWADGAPKWATLDGGHTFTRTNPFSLAYMTSEAVQSAFDNFWANAPAPDGKGLQDHYSEVWQAVARRFANESAVVGYDLMNEPAMGKDMARSMVEASKASGGRRDPGAMADPVLYDKFTTATATISQPFERNSLMPFYQRAALAIRKVDAKHIIAIEPEFWGSVGVPSGLAPLKDSRGRRDPQQMYAPHAYDFITEGSSLEVTNNRIKATLELHKKEAKQMGMPLFIGEWGAFDFTPKNVERAKFTKDQIYDLACGDTYWAYEQGQRRDEFLEVLRLATTQVDSNRK